MEDFTPSCQPMPRTESERAPLFSWPAFSFFLSFFFLSFFCVFFFAFFVLSFFSLSPSRVIVGGAPVVSFRADHNASTVMIEATRSTAAVECSHFQSVNEPEKALFFPDGRVCTSLHVDLHFCDQCIQTAFQLDNFICIGRHHRIWYANSVARFKSFFRTIE